jgi:hypothetical protein
LLDELRVLTNLVRNGLPRVRLILAGSSALEESFAHPELESFSQRLATRCYLSPFNREETSQFVRAQIAACGASPETVFNSDAWDAIFEATDGVPRLINQLCDRALLQGTANGRPKIDRSIIQAAWADIQQLPAPWETPAPTTAPPAPLQVVEFGRLDDEIAEIRSSQSGLLVVDRIEIEDDVVDSELTEIDYEEEVAESETAEVRAASAADEHESVDPFAEKFDEEEVVLDNFAGWDNMFRREAPRVKNRRDPSFAALVEAALPASKTREKASPAPTVASTKPVAETKQDAAPGTDDPPDWPPLRLAFGADAMSPSVLAVEMTPVETPSLSTRSELASHQAAISAWSRTLLSHDNPRDCVLRSDDDPVLIVEDDQPATKSPVRREEYRDLFSRLRGN